jgi:hypothetical protein
MNRGQERREVHVLDFNQHVEETPILIMNLMLRARTLSGVPRDITVWEAHYGQRPNVGELLLGPFGCLAYLVLTKETRQRKGMSTYWGGIKPVPDVYPMRLQLEGHF